MGMTPAEIRHVPIRRALWGYRRTAVEHLLDDCADSFEEVWRERADFADRIEHLERAPAPSRARDAAPEDARVGGGRGPGATRGRAA